mgnify:CR=1 FL=1
MVFQIVQCEVIWIATIGYSGNELPPSNWETIGEFEDEGDACRALAEAGLTRQEYGFWKGAYSSGYIKRTLKELT